MPPTRDTLELSAIVRRLVAAAIPLATVGCCDVRDVTQEFQLYLPEPDGGTTADADPSDGSATADATTVPDADPFAGRNCMIDCAGRGSCTVERVYSCSYSYRGTQPWVSCRLRTNSCLLPPGAICGRRPENWSPADRASNDTVGALGHYLAHAADLEAASVVAFARLADELATFGAPDELIRDARRAARDETRHARTMRRLALRHGASDAVIDPRGREPRSARTLAAMLRENAVEGCARETFGAVVAAWQSHAARDRDVAGAMRSIARDELAHADLAWRIHATLTPRLDAAERRDVAEAMHEAFGELYEDVADGVAADVLRDAGMPNACQARTLVAELRAAMDSRMACA